MINISVKISALVILLISCSVDSAEKLKFAYSDYVNPMVGTTEESGGGLIPAVTSPFGMVQFTPVTNINKIGITPYYYNKKQLIGFMATHQPSPWMGDYGYLTFWPGVDHINLKPEDRALTYSHKNEFSKPYYYKSIIKTKGSGLSISSEITATKRCGYFRFTFPSKHRPNLTFEFSRQSGLESRLVDANAKPQRHIDYIKETRKDNFQGWVRININENEITGYNPDRHSFHLGPELKNFKGYYVIQLNKKISDFGVWQDSVKYESQKEITGNHVGAYIYFEDEKTEEIELRIGTSFISIEQARKNMENEIPGWNFEEVKRNLKEEWDKRLKVIELLRASEEQKTIFYTAMYHCLLYPRTFSEYGRYYSAFDDSIHDGVSFNDYSLWDTFRALHPLLIFIAPDKVPGMINSFAQMYEEGGWIPKWPNPAYSNIMIGTHADAVVADAFVKGIEGIDYEKVYEAIRKDAFEPPVNDTVSKYWNLSPWKNYEQTPKTTANPWWDRSVWTGGYEGRGGLSYYDSLGYVPQDKTRESVSRTLEFAYDDYCVAQVAKGMGYTDDYNYLMKRALNYKNVYNPQTGLMAVKDSNGNWMKDSLKLKREVGPEIYLGFTEGSPYTYQFCVMQDVQGLVELMGGEEEFTNKLDFVFDNGFFEHTNEPCHHYPYLYNYAGKPWKTQKIVRKYTLSQYRADPGGVRGNDDCGQMSAWYIFSSLGFYPVCPGKAEYAIGSPAFDEVKINLSNGKDLIIKTLNNSKENYRIKNIKFNGKVYNDSFFNHFDLMKGGEIVFEMQEGN